MNAYKQLCWKCKKACDKNLCSWVSLLIKPAYCECDENGFIVKCSEFEHDGKTYSKLDIAKILNISIRKYNYLRDYITRHGLQLSIAECYAMLEERKKFRETVSKKDMRKIYSKRHYQKKKQIKIKDIFQS